jgi:hypothetical protein
MAPIEPRMPSVIRIAPIALLLLAGAEATILNLSCDGTVTKSTWDSGNGISKEREPVTNMSLVADFAGATVTGFLHPARITKADAHYVRFSGSTHGELAVLNGTWTVNGSINRITGGVVAATIRLHPTIPSKLSHLEEWALVCKPVQ